MTQNPSSQEAFLPEGAARGRRRPRQQEENHLNSDEPSSFRESIFDETTLKINENNISDDKSGDKEIRGEQDEPIIKPNVQSPSHDRRSDQVAILRPMDDLKTPEMVNYNHAVHHVNVNGTNTEPTKNNFDQYDDSVQSNLESVFMHEKEAKEVRFFDRAEYFITSIDKAIQTFMEHSSFGEGREDGNIPGIWKKVKFIITNLYDNLIGKREWFLSLQDFHNPQNLNYLFLTISLVTVIPITRWFIIYIFDLALHLFLTIVGTIAGVVAGAILAINFYQKIYVDVDEHDGNSVDDDETEEPARVAGQNRINPAVIIRSDGISERLTSPSNVSKRQLNTTAQSHGQIHLPAHSHSSSDTYVSLMASAGYAVTTVKTNEKQESHQVNHNPVTHLRGQILRNVSPSSESSLSFVKDPTERNSIYESPSITNYQTYKSKGLAMFQRMWPDLPEVLQKEFGELMDFITRDYVLSWYHYIDDGVGYENEVEKRSRLTLQQSSKSKNDRSSGLENRDISTEQSSRNESNDHGNGEKKSIMLLSTAPARNIPFLEIFYSSLSTILGKLVLSCENINVPYLVLVKFLNIFKVNVRTYKDIRKIVVHKQKQKKNNSKENPAQSIEIAVAREYLLQGKLHRAITFGLDVPGLLFGDSNGKECPVPSTHLLEEARLNFQNEEDFLLEQRLFGYDRRILHECEVDYNRVLSHRLCRILFPRADFASPVLRSACVELLASMILTPIMGCFTPDYINTWIKASLPDGSSTSENIDGPKEKSTTLDSNVQHNGDLAIECDDGGSGADSNLVDRGGGQSPSNDISSSAVEHLVEEFDLEELDDDLDEVVGATDSFGSNSAEEVAMKISDETKVMDICDEILALLAMSLIELQAYIDFDEARDAKVQGEQLEIKWNDQGCIETVRNLVLVIEAMLMHGALMKRRKRKVVAPPSGSQTVNDVDSTKNLQHAFGSFDNHEYSSLTVTLMEITSNLESFESETKLMKESGYIEDEYEEYLAELDSITRPKASDLSTLRTLIAAWLHTGVVYRTLHVFLHSHDSILYPFYHKSAFIRKKEYVNGFLRQLRVLHNVDIMVDTLTILSCPPLDLYLIEDKGPTCSNNYSNVKLVQPGTTNSHGLETLSTSKQLETKRSGLSVGNTIKANLESNRKRFSRLVRPNEARASGSPLLRPLSSPKIGSVIMQTSHQSIPPYLAFHMNEVLASSLRSERNERRKSFLNFINESTGSKKVHLEMICRSNIPSQDNLREHRDLHNLAKGFYSSTTALSLQHTTFDGHGTKQTLLIMDNITTRRKWAVPYDDTSFLMRAQSVQLDVIGIHRDERSHDLSYKKYAAYFDEPILHESMNEFRGAKLRRKCFLRYYPSDRTAAINFIRINNCLDSQLGRLIHLETSGASKQIKEFERYLCNKSYPEGSERSGSALTNSLLSSTLMESNDFSKLPRPGKMTDFVYRLSLYEEPEIELSGNRFIVQDASCIGAHRADASSLEISDASLTTCLLLGQTFEKRSNALFHVKCDDYGVPIVHLKLADQSVDESSPLATNHRRRDNNDFRPYRLSFVRAALLLSTSRKEAQMQYLMGGSVKNITKSQSEDILRPAMTLLDYATSKNRDTQAILIRDLKIGVNHIDREQLRRSGMLDPRYPTRLKDIKVHVEGVTEVKTTQQPLDLLAGQSTVLFRLKCIAISEFVGVHKEDNTDDFNLDYGELLKEEWTVLRSFKDFTILHKFLKTQVNAAESSAGTAAKLTGLATNALTLGSLSQTSTKRKALIPSLNKAVQAGALGVTKKCIERRKEILNGYLSHLFSHGNLLRSCPELLRFVGAYEPLPEEVKIGRSVNPDFTDRLGRFQMNKLNLRQSVTAGLKSELAVQTDSLCIPSNAPDASQTAEYVYDSKEHVKINQAKMRQKPTIQQDSEHAAIFASIKSRVDRVKLSQIRGSVFELIRYIFDLDGANFFRSQMISALKTMSIAVTSATGFKRTLIEFHLKHLSSRSIASYVRYIKNLIWPNGVIFESAPPLTKQESIELSREARKILRHLFPDQLSAILGNEITENGIELLHEMLNNRLVLKSIFYMMADTLLLEVFPELSDVLTCSQVLDTATTG
mmetsp:Transcript_17104/g.32351  ORF Transcript_17104/g.32351 Transcript_17104/m.32351 type:complete len:2095 (-) Transcript_17104:231-6515(-)